MLLFNHLVLFSVYYMMISSSSPIGCADTVDDASGNDDDDADMHNSISYN